MTDTLPMTMFVPDFPFAYDDWLRHPAGLGSLPADRIGTPVAVVGAGVSGMVAAHELLRLGLRPEVYECGQVGGRMRSVEFPGAPGCVAELGAMRFPAAATTMRHYIDALGLRTTPFPNPLAEATPSTVVDLDGRVHRARCAADLPGEFQQVAESWHKALNERAELTVMRAAIRARDVPVLKALWNKLVKDFDDESLYGFLASAPGFDSYRAREVFGQVGFGVGGWDTDFPSSALETVRVVCMAAEDDQVSIVGGAQQIPRGLWRRAVPESTLWAEGTSLSSLHGGTPLPGVARIARVGRDFAVTDVAGNTRQYPAVVYTPHVWTLVNAVAGDRSLLSAEQWAAVDRAHYVGATKLYVLTDRPFWRDVDPATGHEVMGMTLTDQLPRSMYLFDHGPDRPGVMCLSYTVNNDSRKLGLLSPAQRLDLVLDKLARIYPGVDVRGHIVGEPVTMTWENEPGVLGAFKTSLPGHYRYQRRLFTQFMQDGSAPTERGFFLAGDDVSWTPGFSEGAVTTALNAVWGVVNHLGGRTDPANPGPGDVFAHIAPLVLPH